MRLKRIVVSAIIAVGLAAVLVLYLGSAVFFRGWTGGNIEHSKAVGEALIGKLERFREETGRYPGRLDELVPGHLATVPRPTAGAGDWDYRLTGDGDSYRLGFGMPRDATWHGYPSCFYDSRYRFWYLDQ